MLWVRPRLNSWRDRLGSGKASFPTCIAMPLCQMNKRADVNILQSLPQFGRILAFFFLRTPFAKYFNCVSLWERVPDSRNHPDPIGINRALWNHCEHVADLRLVRPRLTLYR